VLIVDTDKRYVSWLTQWLRTIHDLGGLVTVDVTGIARVKKAIQLLDAQEFDLLCLRHDLYQEPDNGSNIRDFLLKNPDVNRKMVILCHGMNEVNDPYNAAQLAASGRPAQWLPFGLVESWRFGT
jgi:hypothetical protein